VTHRKTTSSGNARAGSARRGETHPIKPEWQAAVKAEIVSRHMTEKDFSKRIGCAQSTMHDLLNSPEARYSSLVPKIHAFLSWDEPRAPEPMPPIFSRDALEVAGMFDLLPEEIRRSMRDQLVATVALIRKKTGE
jgi:predicted transcriptional regulator